MIQSQPALHRLRALIAIGLAGGLAACAATVDVRGFIPDEEALAKIQPGEQSRDEVRQILGSPSTISAFGDDSWIYVSRKTSSVAFFKPEVTEQNILVVRFNQEGKVDDVRHVALADGMAISPISRTTPAQGKELTFIEQLVGNLGKFNSAPAKK